MLEMAGKHNKRWKEQLERWEASERKRIQPNPAMLTCTVICSHCKATTKVKRFEMRKRQKPRCSKCGGPLNRLRDDDSNKNRPNGVGADKPATQ